MTPLTEVNHYRRVMQGWQCNAFTSRVWTGKRIRLRGVAGLLPRLDGIKVGSLELCVAGDFIGVDPDGGAQLRLRPHHSSRDRRSPPIPSVKREPRCCASLAWREAGEGRRRGINGLQEIDQCFSVARIIEQILVEDVLAGAAVRRVVQNVINSEHRTVMEQRP